MIRVHSDAENPVDTVLAKWARHCEEVVAAGTHGDNTWTGILAAFLREADFVRESSDKAFQGILEDSDE